jgi:hypothetical protein
VPLPEVAESRPEPEAWVGPKETVPDTAPLGATLPETPPYWIDPLMICPSTLYVGLHGPLFVTSTTFQVPSNSEPAPAVGEQIATATNTVRNRANLLIETRLWCGKTADFLPTQYTSFFFAWKERRKVSDVTKLMRTRQKVRGAVIGHGLIYRKVWPMGTSRFGFGLDENHGICVPPGTAVDEHSLRLDIRVLHHLGPFRDLGFDVVGKLRW